MSNKLIHKIKKLSLRKGDILVVERSFNSPSTWMDAMRDAGKEAGINFNVPIVYVDSIDGIAVVRMGENTDVEHAV